MLEPQSGDEPGRRQGKLDETEKMERTFQVHLLRGRAAEELVENEVCAELDQKEDGHVNQSAQEPIEPAGLVAAQEKHERRHGVEWEVPRRSVPSQMTDRESEHQLTDTIVAAGDEGFHAHSHKTEQNANRQYSHDLSLFKVGHQVVKVSEPVWFPHQYL